MNSHRQAKNEQLTRLAGEVTSGVIVELGAYRGEGTVALCQGAKVPVFAIDDYRSRRGWAGEIYSSSDYDEYVKRIKSFSKGYLANLVIGDISQVASMWPYVNLITLLVWDLGMTGRLAQDFEAWQDKVIDRFVIHDTDDQRLGSKELNPAGWRKYKDGVFWILERER